MDSAHGGRLSGDRDTSACALGRVRETSLQRRRAQAGPDKAFHEIWVGAGELIGEGLPLLEEQLSLATWYDTEVLADG